MFKKIASNMYEQKIEDNLILMSYDTPVACKLDGKFYKTEVKFSRTTSCHINKWLAMKMNDAVSDIVMLSPQYIFHLMI